MEIADLVAAFPKATIEALPGLSDAWTFTRGRFRRGIAVSANPEFAFHVTCREPVSVDDVAAILAFARDQSAVLLAAVPFAVADGFSIPDCAATSLISVLPSVADLTAVSAPELSARMFAVFPGWRCEVSGDEDETEASERFDRQFGYSDLHRGPVPFMRLAYSDGEGGGTAGRKRWVMHPDVLYGLLSQSEDRGFAEFENFRREVRRIEFTPNGAFYVDGDRRTQVDSGRLVHEAREFLTGEESS